MRARFPTPSMQILGTSITAPCRQHPSRPLRPLARAEAPPPRVDAPVRLFLRMARAHRDLPRRPDRHARLDRV